MKNIAGFGYGQDWRRSHFAKRVAAAVALAAIVAAAPIHAQNAPANLSPDVQEIVKFTQAHMSDDVILTFIKNSGKTYTLSADDLLYLNNQGVSQAVISALLKTASNAPAPAASAPPPAAPTTPSSPPPPTTPPPPPPPPAGLFDNFSTDAGLNPGLWAAQTPLLQSLAQWSGSVAVPPGLAFGPTGLQMSGVNGPGQLTGVQSTAAFTPPFRVTATVSGLAPEGIPFDVYLVSPDLRQWVSVAGHLGGAGVRGGEIRARVPFLSVRIPEGGHPPSREYGTWVNWTGSGQPIGGLGNQIFPAPVPSVPYTISITVGADGVASVTYQDPAGIVLGTLNAMPVGMGPFNVVLASRGMGPTFANWNSVNVESLAPPPPPVATAPPEVPTLDYFTAHLSPYGQWISVPDVGSAWVPMEANNPDWRPYMDAGHWEYTDAGWFWQSDYPWGDIAFHYGRWIRNVYTGDRWAWAPGYDWAPSWVVWREGDGGMGWAPMPWGVEFHPGVGLWWHGAAVTADVSFGIGFDAFVFVGPDHFWGGDYHHWAFDRERARVFYDHSAFHVGYRMEGGHLHAEGLGREHMAAITHHEVVEHRAEEVRHAEEHRNFARRNEEHHEIARTIARQEAVHAEARRGEAGRPEGNRPEPGRPEANRNESGRVEGNRPEAAQRPGAPTARPGTPARPAAHPAPGKKEDEKKENNPR